MSGKDIIELRKNTKIFKEKFCEKEKWGLRLNFTDDISWEREREKWESETRTFKKEQLQSGY
jgi:hypothetical protein